MLDEYLHDAKTSFHSSVPARIEAFPFPSPGLGRAAGVIFAVGVISKREERASNQTLPHRTTKHSQELCINFRISGLRIT